jgi:hypothetical protein
MRCGPARRDQAREELGLIHPLAIAELDHHQAALVDAVIGGRLKIVDRVGADDVLSVDPSG